MTATIRWEHGPPGGIEIAVVALRSQDASLVEVAKREKLPVSAPLEAIFEKVRGADVALITLAHSDPAIPRGANLRVELRAMRTRRSERPLRLVCKVLDTLERLLGVEHIQEPGLRERLFTTCHPWLRRSRIEEEVYREDVREILKTFYPYCAKVDEIWRYASPGAQGSSMLRPSNRKLTEAVLSALAALCQIKVGPMPLPANAQVSLLFKHEFATLLDHVRALAVPETPPPTTDYDYLVWLAQGLGELAGVSRALVDVLDHGRLQLTSPSGGGGKSAKTKKYAECREGTECAPYESPALTLSPRPIPDLPGIRSVTSQDLAEMLDEVHRAARDHAKNHLVFGSLMEAALTQIIRKSLPKGVRVNTGSVYRLASAADSSKGSQAQDFQVDLILWAPARRRALFEIGDVAVVHPSAVLGLIELKAGENPWQNAEIRLLADRMRWLRLRLSCLQFSESTPTPRVPVLGFIIEIAKDLYDVRMEHHGLVSALVDQPRGLDKRWVRPGAIQDLQHFIDAVVSR